MKLFCAYGAAQALEKDRQTIERAVRDLTPDGYEGKSPRWRLARIAVDDETLKQVRPIRMLD